MESVVANPQSVRRTRKIGMSMAIGVIVILAALVVALFAPWLAPYDPARGHIPSRLQPPSLLTGTGQYLLGTDQTGRDILSNILYGLRISLLIGLGATAIAMVIGWIIGLVSGYFGGTTDNVLMRIADLQLSVPIELVAFIAMALVGSGIYSLLIIIGLTGWPEYARTARASTLQVTRQTYIEAATALGMGRLRILLKHVVPGMATPVIVLMGVQLPRVIMLESTLSFLGVGVPVTTPSLGLLVSRGFQVLFSGNWWVSVMPGLALLILTLGINLVVDGVRDWMDPRTQV